MSRQQQAYQFVSVCIRLQNSVLFDSGRPIWRFGVL